SDRPPLPEGQFYMPDLNGLEVQDEEGNVLGEVIDVEPTNGAQDNLRVEREDGTTFLVPYVPAFIVDVDIEAEVIVVHVIEGLL
ncbi:MAG: PRC-barrel domain-containing protein, partial [Solobacterium sp.]|nr:PRC-barrel domain-containing protein [Solobacterium sp.]